MEETSFSINPAFDKETELSVEGWVNLKVRYSTEIIAGISYLFWKVEGTEQVFRLQSAVIYENHGLNYPEHFALTLSTFREDFLLWESQGFPEDWMKRYKTMFSHLIIR